MFFGGCFVFVFVVFSCFVSSYTILCYVSIASRNNKKHKNNKKATNNHEIKEKHESKKATERKQENKKDREHW